MFKERMKKFVALVTNDIFQALYSVHKKIRAILFPYLLVNLFKQGYFSSVKNYKHFSKFISIKTVILNSIQILCTYAQSL